MPVNRTPRPRELYPSWPRGTIKHNQVHEKIRGFADNIRWLMANRIYARDVRTIAEITGVPKSTIQDLLDGTSWPSGWTIAALEAGLGTELWPRLDREYADKQQQRILKHHNEDLPMDRLGAQNLKKRLGQKAKMG
ncbi:hypothetical protein [Corynebacterium sp. LaCa116]|uniref:hypothetical protein n=1 Tax=Corynebacterium sp. LaCa116 TaxID=3391423 RepID=UPI00398A454B